VVDRVVVLTWAALTGLIVVGFTFLAEAAVHGFRQVEQWGPYGRYLPLVWTPALTVSLVWWTRRFVPGTSGSGIPQVMRALENDLHPAQAAWLVSLRTSLHKIGLVSGGLLPACRSAARTDGAGGCRGDGQCQAMALAAVGHRRA
jgi:H+/Cl- antiporter ClcA